jgi:hypothetical protein
MWRLSVSCAAAKDFPGAPKALRAASTAACCSSWRLTLRRRPFGNCGKRRRVLLAGLHRRLGCNAHHAVFGEPQVRYRQKIGSRALRADAAEAVTCGWLSFVVVVSLAAEVAVKLSALQTWENRSVVFVRNGNKFEVRDVEMAGCRNTRIPAPRRR